MLNLGRFLILLLLFEIQLFGNVFAQLSRNNVIRGDSIELIVQASGNNIKQPQITDIQGFPINGTSKESFFQSINGTITKGVKFIYSFAPDKNITIEPINVTIDGQTYHTQKLKLTVVEPTYNPSDPFTIRIVSNKSKLYRGETLKVDVEYKEGGYVLDRKYLPPKSNDLWLKTNSEVSQIQKDGYNFITISYFFTPQKSGKLSINSAKMRIALKDNRRDSWGFFVQSPKWKNIISNILNLEVQEAPQKIVGNYEIKVAIDKNITEPNKPINLTLEIRGNGNIEDIQPFKINLNSATIYDEKPQVEHRIEKGEYMGYFTQKFAIIPTQSLTIPSFELTFFNPQDKNSYKIKTNPINIKVNQTVKNDILKVERVQNDLNVTSQTNSKIVFNYIYLILAFLGGILITVIVFLQPWKIIKNLKLLKNIISNDRESLKKLLPLIRKSNANYNLGNLISKRIYQKEKIKIDKKLLKKILLDKKDKNGFK
jgi:hypothetical protein